MILYTDIGKDVDDAIAITYAVVSKIPLKSIIITSKDTKQSASICRNLLDSLAPRYPACKSIQVLVGSSNPLRGGESHSNIYQGRFCDQVDGLAEYDPRDLEKSDCVVISPLTDFAGALKESKCTSCLFMGQIIKGETSLTFDLAAYNFRCDPFASEMASQYQSLIPYTFIGKNLAYQVPLMESDFQEVGQVQHPAMQFIRDHAFQSLDAFKNRMPEIYERIYKNSGNMAYCYDPLTMIVLSHPELFTFEHFGHHKIGVEVDAKKAKNELMSALIKGLS